MAAVDRPLDTAEAARAQRSARAHESIVVTDAGAGRDQPGSKALRHRGDRAQTPVSRLDDVFAGAPPLVVMLNDVRTPATSARSSAPPRRAARPGSSAAKARRIRSAGRRCAAPWAARCGCRSPTSQSAAASDGPARAGGLRVFATDAARRDAAAALRSAHARRRSCSAAKARGCRPHILDAADERLTIPMQAPVESLNVAIAAALMLYEAAPATNRRRFESGLTLHVLV